MMLNTTHFGTIEIDEDDIIKFPEGLPGFEQSRRFALIGHDSDHSPFFWLQSMDQTELCFVVTDPFLVYDNYGVDVDDEDVKLLSIHSDNVLTLAIVVIPENIEETRVNLKAPILINIEKRIGKQIIQKNDSLPIRYYLYHK